MLRQVSAPAQEPMGVAELKLRLRIDHSALDPLLPGYIAAARELVERQTGYALARAFWEWSPVGPRTEPLPVWPGVVTSPAGAYPILFTADPGPVPEALKSAMALLVGDMLANTEASLEKQQFENPAVQTLTFPYRRVLP